MFEMMTTLVVVPEKVRVDAILRALTSQRQCRGRAKPRSVSDAPPYRCEVAVMDEAPSLGPPSPGPTTTARPRPPKPNDLWHLGKVVFNMEYWHTVPKGGVRARIRRELRAPFSGPRHRNQVPRSNVGRRSRLPT
jgi:hypothetical protein